MSNQKVKAILTPEFRLSFCNLFEAKPNMNGLIRFEMEMLFPKDRGGAQFNEMMALYNETIANAKFSGQGPNPRQFKEAIIDGSSKKQEGRHGMYMIKANSGPDFPPRVLLPNRTPATSADVYEGCWCKAIVSCYAYEARKDSKANAPIISRGASFNMLTVWKQRDDEPFSTFMTEAEQDELLNSAELPEGADDLDDMLK